MSSSILSNILRKHQLSFYPVVPFDPGKEKFVLFDFTENNKQLTDEILNDIEQFCRYIDQGLAQQNARYGIGGYNEHRTIYRKSDLFDGSHDGEPRRLHLGIDIWGNAGTPVFAPLDGHVHSFAFNNHPGDYGATVILQHQLDGESFYTLYGHLSFDSLTGLVQGKAVQKAEVFASFGVPAENGYWPPHLHFQVIKDIQTYKGDYPGVCKLSEKKYYLDNCPDPDLILNMSRWV
jgi:murein DD-endopeptidase MepM/ murein hydrolase activator NlpD